MKTTKEYIEDTNIEEVEPKPTLEEILNSTNEIQSEWNKPQDDVPFEPYVPGEEELAEIKKQNRMAEIKSRLNALDQDIIQHEAGEIVPNYPERLEEFRALHNELRALEGKEPRKEQI